MITHGIAMRIRDMRAHTILVFGMKQGIIRADHAFIQGLHMHETLLMICLARNLAAPSSIAGSIGDDGGLALTSARARRVPFDRSRSLSSVHHTSIDRSIVFFLRRELRACRHFLERTGQGWSLLISTWRKKIRGEIRALPKQNFGTIKFWKLKVGPNTSNISVR
jgi:hypothetical protein